MDSALHKRLGQMRFNVQFYDSKCDLDHATISKYSNSIIIYIKLEGNIASRLHFRKDLFELECVQRKVIKRIRNWEEKMYEEQLESLDAFTVIRGDIQET